MIERFQNKYRISSARLKTWDYCSNAAYFITLCTRDTNFAWQPRYHEHIIRDAASFVRIQEYIVNNLTVWTKDKFYILD